MSDLRGMVAERNAQNRIDAWVEIGFGAAICAFCLAAVIMGSLLVLGTFLPGLVGLGTLVITLVFACASTASAWHRVDPLASVSVADFYVGGSGRLFSRGDVASVADGLISGPRRLFQGWRSLRRVIPWDDDLEGEVLGVLKRCNPTIPLDAVDTSDRGLAIASALGLVKETTDLNLNEVLELTARGRGVLERIG